MKVKKLEWDSEFFKINVANLQLASSQNDISELAGFIKKNNIRLCQCSLDITDRKNINLLSRNGFEYVDLKVFFKAEPLARSSRIFVRLATQRDIPIITDIAGKLFYANSRFRHKEIAKNKVNAFYRLWAQKAVFGTYDDVCFVAERKGDIVGFVTYKDISPDASKIGLIGVSDQFQGMGVGSSLISKVLSRARKDGKKTLEVSTEGSNIAAQNFYYKNGFTLSKIQSWYYKWID